MNDIQEVLLVDDDIICNFFMKNLLDNHTTYNGAIHTTLNGKDAFDFIKDNWSKNAKSPNDIKLILLDLNMPVMNGFEFLDAYANYSANKDLKIVIYVLSSSLNTRDKEKALSHPFVRQYLTKPIDAMQLQEILSTDYYKKSKF